MSMMSGLALAATGSGIALLYAAWRQRASRPWTVLAGWAALLLAIPAWVVSAGPEFGPVYLVLTLPFLAWLATVVHKAGSSDRTRAQPRSRLARPAVTTLLQHGALFLLSVPIAGAAALLFASQAATLLPLNNVDRMAAGLIAVPLIWGGLAFWICADPKTQRPALATIAVGIVGGVLLSG
jgi:hypothetical protein